MRRVLFPILLGMASAAAVTLGALYAGVKVYTLRVPEQVRDGAGQRAIDAIEALREQEVPDAVIAAALWAEWHEHRGRFNAGRMRERAHEPKAADAYNGGATVAELIEAISPGASGPARVAFGLNVDKSARLVGLGV